MIGRYRHRLRTWVRSLLAQHTAPGRIALAVWVGCVVGCTPLFGLHLPICIALSWVLGLNQLVVYGAANLSIPPLVPLLGFTSVQLGERLLHGRYLSLTTGDFHLGEVRQRAHQFFGDWLVGGLVLGTIIGGVAGVAAYLALSARRAAVDGVGHALKQAAARYRDAHPRYKWYARMKYRLDPCYRAISAHVPADSFTVDLGTGLGMLPVLLGVLGGGRRVLGVEWDVAKVACAERAAAGLSGVEVREGDVRGVALPTCDVITLVDMLHYYDDDAQRALLQRCQQALNTGGRLLVREGDGTRRGGARWTRWVESTVTRLGWNHGPQVRFRPIAALRKDLEALGFQVRVDEVAGKLHPGNVLLIAERR